MRWESFYLKICEKYSICCAPVYYEAVLKMKIKRHIDALGVQVRKEHCIDTSGVSRKLENSENG